MPYCDVLSGNVPCVCHGLKTCFSKTLKPLYILVAGAISHLDLPSSDVGKVKLVAGGCNPLSLADQELIEASKRFRFDLLFNAYDITDALKENS